MTDLYDLLPRVYRRRDADSGSALQGLLAVIGEQRQILSDAIDQLYDDWFIETCQDWVVPYIGELVGYQLLHGYEEALGAGTPEAGQLLRAIAPRADVAGTIAARRRKGTLSLLQDLAVEVTGWPARAVEFRRLLAFAQPIRLESVATRGRLRTGQVANLRAGDRLDRLGGPFDDVARGADVRRITSSRTPGRYGIDEVGLFVWRLRSYSVTRAPAFCIDRDRAHYTFSVLGNDVPLGTRPASPARPGGEVTETDVPGFIRRRAFEADLGQYYGPGKSLCLWVSGDAEADQVPPSQIVPADLSGWGYIPARGQIAVDPVLGRIAFPPRWAPDKGVWVSYRYLLSADIGGGEYPRTVTTPADALVYQAGPGQRFETITAALAQWTADKVRRSPRAEAIIELVGSAVFTEQLDITVDPGDRLTIRAAQGSRPVIRLLDWYANRPDSLRITGTAPAPLPAADAAADAPATGPASDTPAPKPPTVTLDGLLITGRSVRLTGNVGQLRITDCTLVPGWSLDSDCRCEHPGEPSLELTDTTACVQVDRSILGAIRVIRDEVHADPSQVFISDSVLDATARDGYALAGAVAGAVDRPADVTLAMRRTTVFGRIRAHAVTTVDNSIITGCFEITDRQHGCVRFCWIAPGSLLPRQFHCEPALSHDPLRVVPRFTSERYGTPGYAQLSQDAPPEVFRGADDGAEMGAFHDLFQPQRLDNLALRLAEYTPAGCDAGIVIVT